MTPLPLKPISFAEPLPLRQSWLPEPEPGFQPGEVRVGWTPDAFQVNAVLTDRDVFNPETRFNAPAFLEGDVFEIFVQPPGAETYFEFHVGPGNQLFQLRIPSSAEFYAARDSGIRQDWLIQDSKINSEVDLGPGFWRVTADIPASIMDVERIGQGQAWKMSFCRYDANRSPDALFLSSTSPIKELDFHRSSEWIDFLIV